MGYSKHVIEKVQNEFESRRADAVRTLEERQAEMYEKYPVLRQIDAALGATGLKVYKAALDGKDGLEERIEKIKKESLELQDDKKRILKMSGKPENYLDIVYACKKCSDTGYAGLKMCSCMKKALVKEAYETSGLGAVLNKQNFDNFDIELYSDKKSSAGASPRDMMTYVLKSAKDYVKDFGKEGKSENLLFIGKTGLGKTHISTAIAKGVIDKGYDVVYDTITNIINTYEQLTFSHSEEAAAAVDRYNDCALLIIDDLGTEFKNSFTQSVLYNLLNTRIISGKAMIISTNLDDSELFKKQYDDRINSRLIGNFRSFKFAGEDIRIKNAVTQAKKKSK